MALVASGISVKGRERLTPAVVSGGTYTMWFPDLPFEQVNYKGVWEVVQSNDPFPNIYSQRVFQELWTYAQRFPVGTLPAGALFALSWRLPGLRWEIHR